MAAAHRSCVKAALPCGRAAGRVKPIPGVHERGSAVWCNERFSCADGACRGTVGPVSPPRLYMAAVRIAVGQMSAGYLVLACFALLGLWAVTNLFRSLYSSRLLKPRGRAFPWQLCAGGVHTDAPLDCGGSGFTPALLRRPHAAMLFWDLSVCVTVMHDDPVSLMVFMWEVCSDGRWCLTMVAGKLSTRGRSSEQAGV